MVKAILTKPLDGFPEGAEREFDTPDFNTLEKMGAVRRAPEPGADGGELRTDGPTVEEYVAAGYRAENYPPLGYAARSTPEEIAEAVAAQGARSAPEGADKDESAVAKEKAAPAVQNKKAPAVPNKGA